MSFRQLLWAFDFSSLCHSSMKACILPLQQLRTFCQRLSSFIPQLERDGKLLYWNRFLDKAAAATRAALAILIIAAIVDYVPKNEIAVYCASFTAFAPMIAANAGERTLGKIFQNVVAVFEISILTMCVTLLVFRFLEPPFHLGLSVVCIGIGAFLISYPAHITLMGKKVGLSQIVNTFVTAHLKADLDVVHQPVKILSSITVGTAAALIAYSFPAPRLAIMQVQQSANSAVRCLNELFKTATCGFSVNDANSLYSICVHTSALRKSVTDVIKQLHSIQADLWWELRACCSMPALNHLINGLTKLDLHIAGMDYSLHQSDHLLHSPPMLRDTMKESLELLVDESSHLLVRATGAQLFSLTSCLTGTPQGPAHIEESKEALYIFDETFLYARKMAYYSSDDPHMTDNAMNYDSSSSCILEGLVMRGQTRKHMSTDTDDIPPSSRGKFMARATAYFFLFNVKLYIEQAMQLVDPYYKPLRERKVPGLKKWIPGLEQRMSLAGDSMRSPAASVRSPAAGGPVLAASSVGTRSPSPSTRSRPPELVCNACASIRVRQELESGFSFKVCEKLKSLVSPDLKQMKFAFKISVALMLATLFGALDLEGDSRQAWAATTVCYIIGYHQGGTFQISLQRFQGTTIGAVFGYLAIRGSGAHGYIIMIVITLWTLCTNIVKHSKIYGYSGGCAGSTAVGMMLGENPEDVQTFAVQKITQTFIGVLSYMLVEILIFPDQARNLVKIELAENIGRLRNAVADIVDMYTGARSGCLDCRHRRVEEIKNRERQLRTKLDHQVHLQEEAGNEPDLWWVPFPGDMYTKIVRIQGNMLDLLLFMVCCLQASAEDEYDDHMQILLEPLQLSLKFLKEDVTSTMDLLQKLLNDRSKKRPGSVERDCCCCKVSVTFQSSDDLENAAEQETAIHPIRVLDNRRRTVGGTPLDLKSTMDSFEHVYESVFEDIIADSKKEGNQIVNNSVMLSISSLSFCLHALLRETVELEKAVYNLLQAEQPWSVLDFWDAYAPNRFSQRDPHE